MRSRLLFLLCLAIPASAHAYPFGIFGYAETGCGSGGSCHLASSPTTRVCIVGLPDDGTYVPNESYPLTLFVDGIGVPPLGILTGGNVAGFNLAASAGAVASEDPSVQQSGNELSHAFGGTHQNHWVFTWMAPAGGAAAIHVAGNAVNGDGTNQGGDLWSRLEVNLSAGTGGGAGEGLHCNPPLPLTQLLPLPLEPAAVSAH